MASPSAPAAALPGEASAHFSSGDFHFEADRRPLSRSEDIDEMAKRMSLCKVPDMLCGGAAFRVRHGPSRIMIQMEAEDALLCCRWSPPPPTALLPLDVAVQADGPFFGAVRCQFADTWRSHGDNPDVKLLVVTSDWTCSTPYWGSTCSCPDSGATPSLLAADAWEVTEEGLPMDLLRQRDEISWYNEVLLWEDELADNGLCRVSIRVRVMPSFWFALLICEVRVDNILLREVATRFFSSFNSDYVLREWTWKESSFEALRQRGVNLSTNKEISDTSIGTSLLSESDVRCRLRHKLRLEPKDGS